MHLPISVPVYVWCIEGVQLGEQHSNNVEKDEEVDLKQEQTRTYGSILNSYFVTLFYKDTYIMTDKILCKWFLMAYAYNYDK